MARVFGMVWLPCFYAFLWLRTWNSTDLDNFGFVSTLPHRFSIVFNRIFELSSIRHPFPRVWSSTFVYETSWRVWGGSVRRFAVRWPRCVSDSSLVCMSAVDSAYKSSRQELKRRLFLSYPVLIWALSTVFSLLSFTFSLIGFYASLPSARLQPTLSLSFCRPSQMIGGWTFAKDSS